MRSQTSLVVLLFYRKPQRYRLAAFVVRAAGLRARVRVRARVCHSMSNVVSDGAVHTIP